MRKEKSRKAFIFRVYIKDGPSRSCGDGVVPRVEREIAILETQSLYTFAKIIVKSFNFYFDHCFGFYSNLNSYHDSFDSYELFVDIGEGGLNSNTKGVKKTKIKDVFYEYEKMLFLFDYGDGWRFVIEREKIEESTKDKKYPFVVDKKGTAPLQYPPLEEEQDSFQKEEE